ncbi:MAG: hypothetical protein ACOC9Z_03590 [Chloroflexota bacterium]
MNIDSKRPESNWDRRLQEVAASFQYPPTPDISSAVHKRLVSRPSTNVPHWIPARRRLAMAVLVALFMLATLLAVPTVRAAIARFLQVGAVTIFVGETDEEATSPSIPALLPTKQPAPASEPGPATLLTPPAVPDMLLATPTTIPRLTPTATPAPLLEGPLTLDEAQEAADFDIRLPDASTTLGPPDEIYLQRTGNMDSFAAVILAWFNPPGLETHRLALYQIGVPDYGSKLAARESLLQSEVHGQPAYWIEGEHLLQIPDANGNVDTRLVGSVLVWTEGDMTYRVEGAPSIDDAVNIAQSLEPRLSR